jgi:glycine/D-amino acid oxidase-like deaminating enzyme
VIGGGIIGVFTAYYLPSAALRLPWSKRGRIGAEQSSRNWGWCRQQNRDARELPMASKSLDLWERFAAESGETLDFIVAGYFISATTKPSFRAGPVGVILRRPPA